MGTALDRINQRLITLENEKKEKSALDRINTRLSAYEKQEQAQAAAARQAPARLGYAQRKIDEAEAESARLSDLSVTLARQGKKDEALAAFDRAELLGNQVKKMRAGSGLERTNRVAEVGKAGGLGSLSGIAEASAQALRWLPEPDGITMSQEEKAARIALTHTASNILSEKSEESRAKAKEGLGTVGQALVDVGVAGTQLLGDAVLGGGNALVPMAVRSFGSGAQEARQAGASETQQLLYGAASAGVEVLTEKLSSVATPLKKIFGAGFADGVVDKLIGKLSSRGGQIAARWLAAAGGEGLEELISGAVNPALKGIYNEKSLGKNYSEANVAEILYEGLIGATLGGLGGAVDVISPVGENAAGGTLSREAKRAAEPEAVKPLAAYAQTQQEAQNGPQQSADADSFPRGKPFVSEESRPVEEYARTQQAKGATEAGLIPLAPTEVRQTQQAAAETDAEQDAAYAKEIEYVQAMSEKDQAERAEQYKAVKDIIEGLNEGDDLIFADTADTAYSVIAKTEKGVTLNGEAGTVRIPFGTMPMDDMAIGEFLNDGTFEVQKAAVTENPAGIPAEIAGGFENEQIAGNLSDGSGQWDAGARAGGQAGSLAEGAAGSARRDVQARAALERQNRVDGLRLKRVSPKSLGVANGLNIPDLTVIPSTAWDEEMRETAAKTEVVSGKKVTYFTGTMQVFAGRSVKSVRGVITSEAIFIQAADMKYTVEQIASHEIYHDMAKDYPGLNYSIREEIVQRFSEEKFGKIVERYIEAYHGLLPEDADPDEIAAYAIEEIFADAYAGINSFGAGATQYSEAARGFVEGRGGIVGRTQTADGARAPPAGGQYSVSEEYQDNVRAVVQMEPVAEIDGSRFQKGDKNLIDQVTEYFNELGNVAHNDEIGDVRLTKRGVKSDVNHGIGPKKAAAFAAVPGVIENGKIIDYQEDWKGRGYDTAVIAAPVLLDGESYFEGVVLTKRNGDAKFYLHEIIAEKEGDAPFKTGMNPKAGMTSDTSPSLEGDAPFQDLVAPVKNGSPSGESPSILSLLAKVRDVKNNLTDVDSGEIRFSVSEGDDAGGGGSSLLSRVGRYEGEDPTQIDTVKEMLQVDADEIPARPGEDYSWATKLTGRGVTYTKDISRNLDEAGGEDAEAREILREKIERPFYEAKAEYARQVADKLNDLKEKMDGWGIKMGSEESAAMQWYGEKAKADQYGNLHEYGLQQLKEAFPQDWQNIVKAEKYARGVYDGYIERINKTLERIYPNALENAQERRMKYEATTAFYNKQAEVRRNLVTEIESHIAQVKKELATKKDGTKVKADLENSVNYQTRRLENAKKSIDKYAEMASRARSTARSIEAEIKSGEVLKNKRLQPRKDYFHHFQEIEEGFAGLVNLISKPSDIDSTLAGASEYTLPKTKWAGFMQKRTGGSYTADAVGGMLKYIPAAEYKVNIDPVIAEGRALIKGMAEATTESKNANYFLVWYTDFVNELAGKTNPIDRPIQKLLGRKSIAILRWVNNRVKSNAIMGNFRSAVSQFFNLPNAAFYVQNPIDWTKGAKLYTESLVGRGDARTLMDRSGFMNERYLDAVLNQFDEGVLKAPKKFAEWLLTFGDKQATKVIWSAAYEKGVRIGKANPVEYADDLTRRAVAGRGIGEVPLEQKSQFIQFVAPFQVEVNNQYQILKKAIITLGSGDRKKAAEAALGIVLMSVVSFLMNGLVRDLFGFDVSFDPINAMKDGIEDWDEEQNVFNNVTDVLGRFFGEILSNVPGGTQAASILVSDDTKREKMFGESDPTRFGTGNIGIDQISNLIADLWNGDNITDDLLSAGLNIGLPYGGKQVERIINGLQDIGLIPRVDLSTTEGLDITQQTGGASYSAAGRLRFPIDNDAESVAKGLAFGPFSTDEGKTYLEADETPLSDKQTALYQEMTAAGADGQKTYDLIQEVSEAKRRVEEYGAIMESELSDEHKIMFMRDMLTKEGEESKAFETLVNVTDAGVKVNDYLDLLIAETGIDGKDENGESVTGLSEYRKLEYIESMAISDKQKLAMYAHAIASESRNEDLAALTSAKMDWKQVSGAVNKYLDLNMTEGLTAVQKATEFAAWADQNHTKQQAAAIKSSLTFSSGFVAAAESYEKYTAAGLGSEAARDVTVAISNLEPEAGKTAVSDAQRYKAVLAQNITQQDKIEAMGAIMGEDTKAYEKFKAAIDAGLSLKDYVEIRQDDTAVSRYTAFTESGLSSENALTVAKALSALEPVEEGGSVSNLQKYTAITMTGLTARQQLDAFYVIMSDSEYYKLDTGFDYGVTPAQYVAVKSKLAFISTNDSITQDEARQAIDMLLGVTTNQKAALWQLQNKSWKAANNPYSSSVGAGVRGVLDKYVDPDAEPTGLVLGGLNKLN